MSTPKLMKAIVINAYGSPDASRTQGSRRADDQRQ